MNRSTGGGSNKKVEKWEGKRYTKGIKRAARRNRGKGYR